VRYRHRFRVAARRGRVAAFHRRPESLRAITPPLLPMRWRGEPPPLLADGAEMEFVLWAGPLPVAWRARIEGMSEEGFDDRQLAGPFRSWLHRHRFQEDGPEATWVVDEIEARLEPHPLWAPVGLAMWLGLPLLFAYRGWKTRRLLEE
jgi:ligand-binding SRPBCC domain-containing protein